MLSCRAMTEIPELTPRDPGGRPGASGTCWRGSAKPHAREQLKEIARASDESTCTHRAYSVLGAADSFAQIKYSMPRGWSSARAGMARSWQNFGGRWLVLGCVVFDPRPRSLPATDEDRFLRVLPSYFVDVRRLVLGPVVLLSSASAFHGNAPSRWLDPAGYRKHLWLQLKVKMPSTQGPSVPGSLA